MICFLCFAAILNGVLQHYYETLINYYRRNDISYRYTSAEDIVPLIPIGFFFYCIAAVVFYILLLLPMPHLNIKHSMMYTFMAAVMLVIVAVVVGTNKLSDLFSLELLIHVVAVYLFPALFIELFIGNKELAVE